MKSKFITLALLASALFSSAQVMTERKIDPFTKIEVLGAAKVFYRTSDTLSLKISGDVSESEKVQTISKDGILTVEMKGKSEEGLSIYITNKDLSSVICGGASTFKTSNQIKSDDLTAQASGAASIKADVASKKVSATVSGAANVSLSGTTDELNAVVTGASTLKAYDLVSKKVAVESGGASTAKVNASEKITANASGASSIKIKGDVKDISAESTSASSITRILEGGEATAKGKGDSTTINWKGKKVIIIDGEKKKKKINNYNDFDHWAGFSLGVNGLLTPDAKTKMDKGSEYLDLNYSRCINVQLNLGQKNFHLYKNYVNLVTGIGFEWRRYMLDHKTTMNPDSSYAFGNIDSTNTFAYNKNLFKSTMIQVPLLLEFNTSKRPSKSFHIAIGAIGQFMINAKTKQILERNSDEFTKIRKDTYNMLPWSVKAHASVGYSAFTVFAEYNITPLFEKNAGPQVYPFVAGVRLLAF